MKKSGLVLILILLFAALPANIMAKKKGKKRANRFSLSANVSFFYDNNILRYSDYYLDEFLSGANNGRFHVSTYDDLIIEPRIKIGYRKKIIARRYTEFYLRARYDKFFVNGIKDWAQYSFGLKQYLPASTSVTFEYVYTPYYYIRHYRDKEWTDFYGDGADAFKEYSFAKDDFALRLERKIAKNFSVKLYYSHMIYYYGEFFTEHDASQNLFGGRVYYARKKIGANFGVKYLNSDARGKTGVDPSYYEYKYYFGASYVMPRFFGYKNGVSLLAVYNTRYYVSEFTPESDPVHSGRYDKYYSVYFNYEIDASAFGKIALYLNWNGRNAETVYPETSSLLSRDKDFSQFKIGVKYKYSIKF